MRRVREHIWIVDGNNVFGSQPDGWWRDRAAAAERLTTRVAAWCEAHDQRAVLVFDGRPVARVERAAGSARAHLEVAFAGHDSRDAADHRIVALVEDRLPAEDLTVVSADRGLIDRLPPGVAVEGPSRFLDRLAVADPG